MADIAMINNVLARIALLDRENQKRRQSMIALERRIADLEIDLSAALSDIEEIRGQGSGIRHQQAPYKEERAKTPPIALGNGYEIRRVYQGWALFSPDGHQIGEKGTKAHCEILFASLSEETA